MSNEINSKAVPGATSESRGMKQKDMQQVSTKDKVIKILVQVMLYLFLGVMALIVLFPFYFMIITSLKDYFLYHSEVVPDMFPDKFDWASARSSILKT